MQNRHKTTGGLTTTKDFASPFVVGTFVFVHVCIKAVQTVPQSCTIRGVSGVSDLLLSFNSH